MRILVLLLFIFHSQEPSRLKSEAELSRELSVHMLNFIMETKDLLSDIDSSGQGITNNVRVLSSEIHSQGGIADKIAKQMLKDGHRLSGRAVSVFRKHRDKMYYLSSEFSRIASGYPGADRFDVENFDVYEDVMDALKR